MKTHGGKPQSGARPAPRRALARTALLLLVATVAAGLGHAQNPSPSASAQGSEAARDASARAVRAELRGQCERILASDDPFFGNRNLEQLRRRLVHPSSDRRTRVEELGRYAFELLRIGEHEKAIARAEEAMALLAGASAPAAERYLRALLGVAHYQLGEDQNCLTLGTEASCILPVRRRGLHAEPGHARKAGDHFLALLEEAPDDLASRWMLNLSRMVSGDYPEGVPKELRIPEHVLEPGYDLDRSPPFLNVAERLGVAASDLAGGAIMDDFDGDGRLDLISSSSHPCHPLKAFRNTGSGFEDVAESWQLDAQLGGLNLVHADYDGDGDLDLLVLRGAWSGDNGRVRNSLLRNDLAEDGVFVDVTARARLAYPAYPTQAAAWADYDLDGDLDLFVANEGPEASADPMAVGADPGANYPAQLFRNRGDGAFSEVGREAGLVERTFAKGAAWGDYDNDGDPDLYVSNLGPNLLYRNDGNGSFTEVADELGVTGGGVRTFATWFFDYDNDGDLDLFAAAYHLPSDVVVASSYLDLRISQPGFRGGRDVSLDSRPLLFRNELDPGRGGESKARFREVGLESGFDKSLLPMGANFGDLDGDGRLDLYLGTGMPDFTALHPNVYYRNTEAGFVDLTFESGLGHLQKGHGVAFGDLDHDGRLDLFQQLGGAFPYDAFANVLYLGPDFGHRFLVLHPKSSSQNRFAVGARIEVRVLDGEAGERRSYHRVVGTGGSFGGSSLRVLVGLGNAESVDAVLVGWPGSTETETFSGLELDAHYELIEGAGEARRIEVPDVALDLRPRTHRHEPSRP